MGRRDDDWFAYHAPGSRIDPADPTATPPANASDKQVIEWYQTLLGRTPSETELASHRGNPAGLDGVYGVIARSPEAQAYAKRTPSAGATTGTESYTPAAAKAFMLAQLQGGKNASDVADLTNKKFGLVQGQDGAALYYPGNNTIGMHEFYLAGTGNGWNAVDRPNGGAPEAAATTLKTAPKAPVGFTSANSLLDPWKRTFRPPPPTRARDLYPVGPVGPSGPLGPSGPTGPVAAQPTTRAADAFEAMARANGWYAGPTALPTM